MKTYEKLWNIPDPMHPWQMRLNVPMASDFGEYALVDCQQAGIEQHHEVEVVDENGFPLSGVWVIFGYPGGGPNIYLPVRRNYWSDAPAVLKGNVQKTSLSGVVQHTFQSGGEDIWIWDIDAEGDIKLPSPIVHNCAWQRTPVGAFEHTGVRLTFQRRRVGVVPLEERIRRMEQALGISDGQAG